MSYKLAPLNSIFLLSLPPSGRSLKVHRPKRRALRSSRGGIFLILLIRTQAYPGSFTEIIIQGLETGENAYGCADVRLRAG